jgi:FSR family fosmidomycin resistance protein-like MFS transporter
VLRAHPGPPGLISLEALFLGPPPPSASPQHFLEIVAIIGLNPDNCPTGESGAVPWRLHFQENTLNRGALVRLALIHAIVDAYAQVVAPLWPQMERTWGLSSWSVTFLIASWQVATSVSQPVFGYWGDRFGSRRLVFLGPAVAIVCISLLGFSRGPANLAFLLLVGGVGIGAFHPEAAFCVVEASAKRPARGLALFAFGGMVGLGLGPILSGTLADKFGLHSLAWLLSPSLLAVATLAQFAAPPAHQQEEPDLDNGLRAMLRGRWVGTSVLLGVATLRVVPVLGVPLGLAFLLDQRGASAAAVGWSQGLFLLSGGLGTLLCPLFVRPGKELRALVWTMVPATLFLVLLTQNNNVAYYSGLAGAGLFLQGAMPILIAYSQRLLPQGRRLAASLTLGASWGLGGVIVAALRAYFDAIGHLEGMLWAMVPFALGAIAGSFCLRQAPVVFTESSIPRSAPAGPAVPVPFLEDVVP